MTGETKTLIGISVVTILLFVGGIMALNKKETVESGPVDQAILVRENSHTLGGEEPEVVLVEFADYQCPFCAQSHPFIQALALQYPQRLQLVYRHFPLIQHQQAQLAAEAAEAAGAQDKYWQMHDLIYTGQEEWAENEDALAVFQGYAEQLELDMEQFNQALTEGTFKQKIQQDVADGNAAGVNATPTFFVDGQKFTGSLANLKILIDARLSQSQQSEATGSAE
jgi:protein-disulfide isomerase